MRMLVIAFVVLLSICSPSLAIYLHREFNGLGLTEPFPLKRSEADSNGNVLGGLAGSGLWAMSQMYDASGNLAPFYIDTPRLLVCGGHLTIRHKGVVLQGYGDSYPIYAHTKIHLWGPYAQENQIPALNWSTPGPMVSMHGMNIFGVADHYAAPTFDFQRLLQPGYYRIEFFAGAGTDAANVDNLAELPNFGQQNVHQVFCRVY